MPPFDISPARYANGMMAVRTAPDGTGYKTRADRLACALSRDRYSGREKSWIMSRRAAERMSALYADGWDAGSISRELTPPESERTAE